MFETLDPTGSIPPEAKHALREKLREYSNEVEKSTEAVFDMNEYFGKDSNLRQYESKVTFDKIEKEYKEWKERNAYKHSKFIPQFKAQDIAFVDNFVN